MLSALICQCLVVRALICIGVVIIGPVRAPEWVIAPFLIFHSPVELGVFNQCPYLVLVKVSIVLF